jgi:ABC-type hemin transport system ATPase subunit
MAVKLTVTSLQMSDGTSVLVPPTGVVVFVGPNNSGKSLSLRNIRDHLYRGASPPQAIQSVQSERSGTEEDEPLGTVALEVVG